MSHPESAQLFRTRDTQTDSAGDPLAWARTFQTAAGFDERGAPVPATVAGCTIARQQVIRTAGCCRNLLIRSQFPRIPSRVLIAGAFFSPGFDRAGGLKRGLSIYLIATKPLAATPFFAPLAR
jgi:hypothetical protein